MLARNFSGLMIGLLLLPCLQCTRHQSPTTQVVVPGYGELSVIKFPMIFTLKDPKSDGLGAVVTTQLYEARKNPDSTRDELIFGMKVDKDIYSDTFYAVSLDGDFQVRKSSAEEWSAARPLRNFRYDPYTAEAKAVGEYVRFRGKVFAKTGRSWESAAALPSADGKWLAVFSHTSEKDNPSYGFLGGGGRGKGDMFIDVYDTSSGEKILSGSAPHRGGDLPGRLFDNAVWVENRYLVVPLDSIALDPVSGGSSEVVFLGVLPKR